MDRIIVYPGQIPTDLMFLNSNKNTMVALAKLAAAALGVNGIVNGLAVVPTGPASLNVNVGPGEIYQLANIDGTSYGSLAADTTHQVLKQGIMLDQALLSCPAPGTVGQSINYLIQATLTESDTGAVALPYYNASNPSVAWSGPANSGTPQATQRTDACVVTVKAGAAAPTGTQTTPAPDANNIGLAVVTVANGQATITSANIVQYTGASLVPSDGLASNVAHAIYSKSVAGNTDVALTAQEAAYPILTLTGALTGNINLIVPATSRQRIISNQTTGAFQITVKTAAGTGIVVPQGLNLPVYCDGTNVLSQVSALITQSQGDARYAPIAWSPRSFLGIQTVNSSPVTLTSAALGNLIVLGGGSNVINLPSATAGIIGKTLTIVGQFGAPFTINRSGTDQIWNGAALVNSLSGDTDSVVLSCSAVGVWYVVSGSLSLPVAGVFASSIAANGYQRLPTGMIVQWANGVSQSGSNNVQTITFPIAFPTACLHVFVGATRAANETCVGCMQSATTTSCTITSSNLTLTNAYIPRIFAIGL